MFTVGAISYGSGALAFALLTLVLLTGWRGRAQGMLLVGATAATVVWAGALAYYSADPSLPVGLVHSLEVLRDVAWFTFLLNVLSHAKGARAYGVRGKAAAIGIYGLCAAVLVVAWAYPSLMALNFDEALGVNVLVLGRVLLSIVGLMLIEQLFRNSLPEQRWGIKYLCLGLGGMFVYDFFMYSDGLLFKSIDPEFWTARGAIHVIVAPLIAVSAARNPKWSLDVFVSRGVVFHTTALLGTGVYLLIMAAAGYYIRIYGGTWGKVGQVAFLSGAVIVLVMILFSGQFRARLKVLLSKHFFNYKYDYREEWLRFIGTLSSDDRVPLRERAIRAVAQIVESPGGVLWSRRGGEDFVPSQHWNYAEMSPGTVEPCDSSLVRFLESRQWVIDLQELKEQPENYTGLRLPEWVTQSQRAWLIVPLMLHSELVGFMLLARSRAPVSFNWEDYDLLKTAGQQAASYVAQMEAAEALAEGRQFETFHRLSAYIVHDLKNIAAQLSLIVSNAEKHKHNPAFMDDAIQTVDNAVGKMNRMLTQLRQGSAVAAADSLVNLNELLEQVCAARAVREPAPELEADGGELYVVADRDRLGAVLEHIVQNAQEAVADDGRVVVRLKAASQGVMIEIEDTGVGMDERFVRERLFRPFDTTKGNAGMGIGAYEAREFIHSAGGDVQVWSAPGEGTRFTFSLPMADQARIPRARNGLKEVAN